MRSNLQTSVLLTALSVVGCDTVAQPAETLAVETDRAVYAPSDTVTVSFVNRRPSTVYVTNRGCYGVDGQPLPSLLFERREQGEWASYSPGYGCYTVYVPPTELETGTSYDVRFLVGVLPGLPPGTYRYVVQVTDETQRVVLPAEERASNAFDVRG